jgi:hypothetical protein
MPGLPLLAVAIFTSSISEQLNRLQWQEEGVFPRTAQVDKGIEGRRLHRVDGWVDAVKHW